MPLEHGSSQAVVSHNIAEMVKAGHPQKQAVAAALRESRGDDAPDTDVFAARLDAFVAACDRLGARLDAVCGK